MTALSNMPAQAMLPLAAYDLDELLRNARRSSQTVLRADFAGAADKATVMNRIAEGFALPKHFGGNLDALYDCLTDLSPASDADQPGFVVILQQLPVSAGFDREQRDALLDVFREAADHFFDKGVAFRVFYSVAGARAAQSAAQA
jgi:RNAse (barnase) inhibitor barstar